MTNSFESHAGIETDSPEYKFDKDSILSSELKARISRAGELCKNLDAKTRKVLMMTTKAAGRAASMIEAQATAANDAIFNQRAATFEEYKKAA